MSVRVGAPTRYLQPQPYQELCHTADAGICVEGRNPEELLARLVLVMGSLLAGGGRLPIEGEQSIVVGGERRVGTALAVLRELLFRFATQGVIPASCEVLTLGETRAELRIGLGRYDPDQHSEGMDVKAVTYHAALFEQAGDRWRGQVVFDV